MKKENLIILPPEGRIVFVGDTHGDLDASKNVIKKYLKPDYKIIFLGDYVDRGIDSKGNIDYLLKIKKENPEQVYLLLGNHDACQIVGCRPRDFWSSLNSKQIEYYAKEFANLPLATSIGKVIALHGALPNVKTLDEMNRINDGDDNWMRIMWGDFEEAGGGEFGKDLHGRPQFGRDYFNEIMKNLGMNILIRSHQPHAPMVMHDRRCLTIFTSSAYSVRRIVAIADFKKDIKSIDDLIIEDI